MSQVCHITTSLASNLICVILYFISVGGGWIYFMFDVLSSDWINNGN